MATRWMIEGTWTGYTSAQQRVVHRQVYRASFKKLRAWAEKTYAIRYTDGTMLLLSVRDCKPREVVLEIKSYTKLIEDCAYYDADSVEELNRKQDAARQSLTPA